METEVRPKLLQLAIEHGVTNPPGVSRWHGEEHWKSVTIIGLHLARLTVGANVEFLQTFAVLHDLMRENEYDDPEHGVRAAELFTRLVIHPGLEFFPPYADITSAMHDALAGHVGTKNARRHPNVNVGLCWDADRLHLWRVGIEPDPRYLTTEAAGLTASTLIGYALAERMNNGEPFPTWAEIQQEIETWRL